MSSKTSVEVGSRPRRGGPGRDRRFALVNGEAKSRQCDPGQSNGAAALVPSVNVPAAPPRRVVLRSGSGTKADRLAVAFDHADVSMELSLGGKTLLAGFVETALLIAGQPVNPRGAWQTVCRHTDADGDYLELQLCLGDEVRIDRQFLVSRRERFALLADVVVVTQSGPAPQGGRVEHRLGLTPVAGVTLEFESTTREARLRTEGCAVRVFPLALPQDRVRSTAGSIGEQSGRLTLTQVGAGRGLFAPLIFDWHPHRRLATVEWRMLTVSEPGKVVAADCAAGHRLRMGKHQVLVYRSLARTDEARAVLGYHTRYETVVGTFDSSGNIKPIVLVESD